MSAPDTVNIARFPPLSPVQAYQQSMSVIVLRVTGGLDYSTFILEDELVMPENLPGEVDTDVTNHRPVLERKISVEQSGGKKKASVDRAQVNTEIQSGDSRPCPR